MFAGIFRGTGLGAVDPEEVREPPPPPTILSFPEVEFYGGDTSWNEDTPPHRLERLFSKILKPVDIKDEHAIALNICCTARCPIENVVPQGPDGQSFLPEIIHDSPNPGKISYSEAAKLDREDERREKDFVDRMKELEVENGIGFAVVSRQYKGDVKPPRLSYMRKFWESLENMSRYWDTSLDQYFGQPTNGEDYTKDEPSDLLRSDDRENSAKRQRMESDSPPPDSNDGPRTMYKGRRISSGAMMPDKFRAETLQAFIEGVAWTFQSTLSPPRVQPRVRVGKLSLPIRQSAAVYRVPKDRTKGRLGWLEGPIFGLQTRPEVDFSKPGSGRMDHLREVGELLHLAQERHREGKTEVKPGEGQWWTTRPRWGGGEGGDVQNEIGNSDVLEVIEDLLAAKKAEKFGRASRARPKSTPAILWKEVRCGKGYWDPKCDYEAIGKDKGSPYDMVFLVSSINCHASLSKLTVHSAYLDYLETGEFPNPLPLDPSWCKPQLERSQWYDLFQVDQRMELFRGLWGVMAYLTGDHEKQRSPKA